MLKHILRIVLLTALFAVMLTLLWVGYGKLIRESAAVRAGDYVLSCGELQDRAMMLRNDRIKTASHCTEEDCQKELRQCEEEVATRWLFKVVLMDAALKKGLRASAADMERHRNDAERQLKERGMSIDEYLNLGPVDKETLLREFDEVVLVRKLIQTEVEAKIPLTETNKTAAYRIGVKNLYRDCLSQINVESKRFPNLELGSLNKLKTTNKEKHK